MLLKTLKQSLINLIYPLVCVNCGCRLEPQTKPSHICQSCFALIKRNIPPFCVKCGRSLIDSGCASSIICSACKNKNYIFDRVWSACKYEDIIKELIHMFKYQRKIYVKDIFEELIKEFFDSFKMCFAEVDCIIPIPLSSARYREREFNQAQIFAETIGQILAKPVLVNILCRTKNTKPQAYLNEQQRQDNLNGCFTIRNFSQISQKNILLVDDVLTTGATASEAAKALKSFYVKKIIVFTLAS